MAHVESTSGPSLRPKLPPIGSTRPSRVSPNPQPSPACLFAFVASPPLQAPPRTCVPERGSGGSPRMEFDGDFALPGFCSRVPTSYDPPKALLGRKSTTNLKNFYEVLAVDVNYICDRIDEEGKVNDKDSHAKECSAFIINLMERKRFILDGIYERNQLGFEVFEMPKVLSDGIDSLAPFLVGEDYLKFKALFPTDV